MTPHTAVIADDEPLLLSALERALQHSWPELQVVATAQNGIEAIEQISRHQPDVVFLDIQMPGANGIEVAHAMAEEWPEGPGSAPLPLWVFVTAFDDYAVDAFDAAAVDYVLKPVKPDRLQQAVGRIRARLESRHHEDDTALDQQLRHLINSELQRQQTAQPTALLRTVNATVGEHIRVIPIGDVVLFESADKYVSVITADGEAVIREPLKKLLPQLDPTQFAQIHRGAIVNLHKVEAALRDASGKMTLRLQGSDRLPTVSRVYRSLFQPM